MAPAWAPLIAQKSIIHIGSKIVPNIRITNMATEYEKFRCLNTLVFVALVDNSGEILSVTEKLGQTHYVPKFSHSSRYRVCKQVSVRLSIPTGNSWRRWTIYMKKDMKALTDGLVRIDTVRLPSWSQRGSTEAAVGGNS